MSAPELIEVKADCPRCGCRRFPEQRRYRDVAGWVMIRRKCARCGFLVYVRQVMLSEVSRVITGGHAGLDSSK